MRARALNYMVFCAFAASALAAEELTLTVSVTGLEQLQGQVFVSLFDEEDDYLKRPLMRVREPVKGQGSLEVTFEDLPSGDCAVSVVHGIDSDGELDTGMFRIPKEPIGFSNNARGKFGPAKWKHTNFMVDQDNQITIRVADAIQ